MKPYGAKNKKTEHASVVVGHPRECGGCRRNLKVRVTSKKAARQAAKTLSKEME